MPPPPSNKAASLWCQLFLFADVYKVCIITVGKRVNVHSRDVIKALTKAGWFEVRQVGSHKQFKHSTKKGRVTVPHPNRNIPIGTLKSIEKQAGIKLR
ncbi:MAG: type II toxin-antitoxin system HicA family toxin [Candidatus Sulfotelmatobacter sp.]